MIIECRELSWLCKNMKKVRSSQAAILVLNWVKHSFSLWVSLMNTLSKIPFYFVKKFLTKIQIYIWHLLIFGHCLQVYPWMKRLMFVFVWFFIKGGVKDTLKWNLKSNSHIPENFCQIKTFSSIVWKNTLEIPWK